MTQLFVSGGQSIEALASVLPTNIQGWFPLRLTGLISLQSKGLSRIFFSTTVRKHQFFGSQPSLWSNCHICIWLLEWASLEENILGRGKSGHKVSMVSNCSASVINTRNGDVAEQSGRSWELDHAVSLVVTLKDLTLSREMGATGHFS